MRGANDRGERQILLCLRRRPALPLRVVPALRQPTHETPRRDRNDGLIS